MPDSDLPPRYRHPALILAICCLSLFVVSLDATVVNVALPSIGRELDAGVSSLQWTLDGYTLVLASLLVLSGSLGDRFGRRRVFQLGLVLFGLGSLACSLAPDVGSLIAARVFQAVGGSMLNPVSLSIVTATYTDAAARAKALGVWGAVAGVSLGAGPLVGGLLTQTVGWRSIFWVNVPIVLVALALTALFVPESRAARRRRVDVVGQVLVVLLLAGTVFGLIEGPSLGWTSPATLAAFTIAVAALVGFLLVEPRRREPLVDPRFFASVPFSSAFLVAVVSFGAWSAFLFASTLYLQDARGLSPLATGLLFLPAGVAILLSSPLSGRLVASTGTRLPLTLAGAAIAASAVLLLFVTQESPVALVAVVVGVFALGFGLVNAPISEIAVDGMPKDQSGAAAAVSSTARQIGVALGIALAGSITGASQSGRVDASFAADARPLWWLTLAAGLLVVALASLSSSRWAGRSSERVGRLVAEPAGP